MAKNLKKIWHFIWHENSIWSWIVNIILAFIIVKFLIYPGLGLVMQTTHPVVAVVSTSMEHQGDFNQWWTSQTAECPQLCTQGEFYQQIGITKEEFKIFCLTCFVSAG